MTTVEETYHLWPDENDVDSKLEITLGVDGDRVPDVFNVFQRSLQAMSDEFELGFHGVEVVDND